MNLYADVIIDITNESLDRPFTYRVPDTLSVCPGQMVKVPFGKTIRKGYVIALKEKTTLEEEKIKEISQVVTGAMNIEAELLSLAIWMHEYYGCTLNRALSVVMPVKSRVQHKVERQITLKITNQALLDCIKECERKKRHAWLRVLAAFASTDLLDYKEAITKLGVTKAVLDKMEKEGVISIHEKRIYRNQFEEPSLHQTTKILNPEQVHAVETFSNNFQKDIQKDYLLYGITGSGKTEVYIEMIKEVLRAKRQVIVLIPEISLTYQTVKRLMTVFGERVAVIHSKLSAGERYDQFDRAIAHDADIMIGPRSAIFTPFDRIGLFIIDEEHDGAYKNDTIPRYHSVDVVRERARICGASVVLSSATPSMISYTRALRGEYTLLTLTKRAVKDAKIPKVHIVDLREELKMGNRSIFSKKLQELIEDRLKKHEQIMLFMNRRGFSNFVSCRTCGEVMKCPHCDVSLTLHRDEKLRCHYCGYTITKPKQCPHCSSPYIAGFGVGTQRIESITKQMFPQARVLRMDLDTSANKNAGREILQQFAHHQADILIGTQMIVKGHDFFDVTLVGIIAADTSLYVSDYTATEKTFQLLTQAAGRAGRGQKEGEVVIQSYNPEHYAIVAAAEQNYVQFYQKELIFRKVAQYPPIFHILTVQISSRSEEKLTAAAQIYMEIAEQMADKQCRIIGPVNAAIYKIQDFYRKMAYIKHIEYGILLGMKEKIEQQIANHPSFLGISLMYDFT